MPVNSISELPKEVRAVIFDDKYATVDDEMYSAFALNGQQIIAYGDILTDIFLGRRKASDVVEALSHIPDSQTIDIKGLALAIAVKRLWPVSFYYEGIDVLISRLGGRIPDEKPISPTALATKGESAEWVQGPARDILQKHKSYSELYITQKPLKDDDDRLKAPSINNWIADFLHTMGAGNAGSLKRTQYLAKSRNCAKLNDEEKKNLLNFLFSYEEDAPMYWQVVEDQYLLIQPELGAETMKTIEEQKTAQQLPELLDLYKRTQEEFRKVVAEKKEGLAIEVGEAGTKLYDIVWDALGLGDVERCLAAIDMLIDRHILWEMLKINHRYSGIVAREIDVRYGTDAKNFWNKDLTNAPMMTILWKLLLVGKLGIEEGRAAIIADYFSRKLGTTLSPIYLDLASGRFLFREVKYDSRAFTFT